MNKVTINSCCGGGKWIGVYFGCESDQNCNVFVGKLRETYENVNGRTLMPTFEIVYVSCDANEDEFHKAVGKSRFVR